MSYTVKVGDEIDGLAFFDNEASPLIKSDKRITQSAMMEWSSCRRKFHLDVNMKLSPKFKNANLTFGDIWHIIMGAHFTEMANKQGGLKVANSKKFKSVAEELSDLVVSSERSQEQVKMATEMYAIYLETFVPVVFAKRYRIVGVECRYETQIPGTDWIMSAGVDVLAYDNEAKKIVIIDHKTTSFSRELYMQDPSMNFQGWDYCSVLSKCIGQPVNDIIFMVSKKKPPSKVPLLDSTMMPSTKRIPDTTYDRFVDELSEAHRTVHSSEMDDNDAAKKGRKIRHSDYMEIMEELMQRSNDHGNNFTWMKFAQVPNDRQIWFWEHARRVVLEIEREREWNMSFSACEGKYGKCVFRKLCHYGITEERIDTGFRVRDGHLASMEDEDDAVQEG